MALWNRVGENWGMSKERDSITFLPFFFAFHPSFLHSLQIFYSCSPFFFHLFLPLQWSNKGINENPEVRLKYCLSAVDLVDYLFCRHLIRNPFIWWTSSRTLNASNLWGKWGKWIWGYIETLYHDRFCGRI